MIHIINDYINNSNTTYSIKGNLIEEEGEVIIREAKISQLNLNLFNDKDIINFAFEVYDPVEIIFDKNERNGELIIVGLTNFIHDDERKNPSFSRFNIKTKDFEANFYGIEGYSYYKDLLKNNNQLYFLTSEMEIKTKSHYSENIIDCLTDLISYSKGTHTTAIYEIFMKNNQKTKIILRPIVTINHLRIKPLIRNEDLPLFLESTYKFYLENYDRLSLKLVLGFYLEALRSKYYEEKYLLASTCLETLLSSYENLCKIKETPIKPSSIKRTEKNIKEFLNEKNIKLSEKIIKELSEEISYNFPSLNDKLSAMKIEFDLKLKPYDYDMPQIRNKITHTGKIPKTIKSCKGEREIHFNIEFNRLIYLIDRILLSILNYNESFYNRLESKYTGE